MNVNKRLHVTVKKYSLVCYHRHRLYSQYEKLNNCANFQQVFDGTLRGFASINRPDDDVWFAE